MYARPPGIARNLNTKSNSILSALIVTMFLVGLFTIAPENNARTADETQESAAVAAQIDDSTNMNVNQGAVITAKSDAGQASATKQETLEMPAAQRTQYVTAALGAALKLPRFIMV